MCESNAFIVRNGKEEPLMESVDALEPKGDEIHLTSLFGEKMVVSGVIKSVSLVDHRIVIEEK